MNNPLTEFEEKYSAVIENSHQLYLKDKELYFKLKQTGQLYQIVEKPKFKNRRPEFVLWDIYLEKKEIHKSTFCDELQSAGIKVSRHQLKRSIQKLEAYKKVKELVLQNPEIPKSKLSLLVSDQLRREVHLREIDQLLSINYKKQPLNYSTNV